ncbi:MAG: VCBS repeat-containing protein [Deltaproteobacteria bacterium]|nr:VCBS repeat-containing protein [Deltaproteobacteria bacterium]
MRRLLLLALLVSSAAHPGCSCSDEDGIGDRVDAALADAGNGDDGGDADAGPRSCQSNLNCRATEVCRNDLCVPYDRTCRTSNDCRGDTRCDSQTGMCIPYDQSFPFDPACVGSPEPGVFVTETQCAWVSPGAGDAFPGHRNVLSTPMVVDFDLDGDPATKQPSIVFVTYTDGDDGNLFSCVGDATHFGVIRIVDGSTCAVQATLPAHVIASSPVALGDLDRDGRPDIVAHRVGGGMLAWGFSGTPATWHQLWDTPVAAAANQCYWSGPSIHDLDDDGAPEVIQGGLVYSAAGVLRSQSFPIVPDDGFTDNDLDLTADYDGIGYIPVLADLDGDGAPELTDGTRILEWSSAAGDWVQTAMSLGGAGQTAVADFGTYGATAAGDVPLTRDGSPEIVVVSNRRVRVMTSAGRVIFGPIALGPAPLGKENFGGPPTIADFDGDGRPEFAVAGSNSLVVYDLDCLPGGAATATTCPTRRTDGILWTRTAQDFTSSVTGVAVFDFEGDGRAEVVYADECFTRVHDGRSGDVIFSASHTSCTWYENPVIADTDADGHAEIVVPGNDACPGQSPGPSFCPAVDPIFDGLRCTSSADCPTGAHCRRDNATNGSEIARCRCTAPSQCGTGYTCADPAAGPAPAGMVCRATHAPAGQFDRGVRVLRDRLDRWVTARQVWNQHAYSITNVDDQGRIPRTSAWMQNFRVSGLNNFRQNVPGTGTPTAPGAPDLTVARAMFMCVDNMGARMSADVCNRGGVNARPGTRVVFYRTGATPVLGCDAFTTQTLAPGQCENVSCLYMNPPGIDRSDIVIRVDDDGQAAGIGRELECYEGNNEDTLAMVGCGTLG